MDCRDSILYEFPQAYFRRGSVPLLKGIEARAKRNLVHCEIPLCLGRLSPCRVDRLRGRRRLDAKHAGLTACGDDGHSERRPWRAYRARRHHGAGEPHRRQLVPKLSGCRYGRQGINERRHVDPLAKSDLQSPEALNNSHIAFTVDYDNGKMDGWNKVYANDKYCPKCAYQYVNPAQIQPYWTMAKDYVLADHMFPTKPAAASPRIKISSAATRKSTRRNARRFPVRTVLGDATLRRARPAPLLTKAGKIIWTVRSHA